MFNIEFNWIMLKIAIAFDKMHLVKRKNRTMKKYQMLKPEIKKYKTTRDYILHHYMNYGIEDCEGKLCAVKQEGSKIISYNENMFPYNLNKNIDHYVLWTTDDMDDKMEEVSKMISYYVEGKKYMFYRNPPNSRSIPDLFHVHVFIKNN